MLKRTHAMRTALRIALSALLLTAMVLAGVGAMILHGVVENAPDIDSVDFLPKEFATFVYDADGNQVRRLSSPGANRTAVSISEIPEAMRNAVVAVEDERFYRHNGVDPRGMIRALVHGVTHGFRFTQGASTITQQLLKNNAFGEWTEEKSLKDRITRKLQEQYLAIRLEKKLGDKDKILEAYLNTINFGGGAYGVEAAARKYLGKDVWTLTPSECAVLAAIPKNPTKYNPALHPEENRARREIVLKKMLEQGYLAEEEYRAAESDDVYSRILEHGDAPAEGSGFTDVLAVRVLRDLQEQKGYSEEEARKMLYSGGLRIYSTLDPAAQEILDGEMADPSNFPETTDYALDWAMSVTNAEGKAVHYSLEMMLAYFRDEHPGTTFASEDEARGYIRRYKDNVIGDGDTVLAERCTIAPQPQASAVVIEQGSGHVKALAGGRGCGASPLFPDRAADALRCPGDTFTVLSAYAEALDSGKMTVNSFVDDSFFLYRNRTQVRNRDNVHRGKMTVRKAIADSVNVPAVRTLTEIGTEKGYARLLKFGFTTLDEADAADQALALGQGRSRVSCLELTAAYAAVANGGVYVEPVFYTKILDRSGSVLIDNAGGTQRAVSEDTARQLGTALRAAVREGTGKAAAQGVGLYAAGKTGEVPGSSDFWFEGFTEHYTCGVWIGRDDGAPLPDEWKDCHLALWGRIAEGLENAAS